MDIFGKRRIAELEAANKELTDRIVKVRSGPSFREVSKNFKIDGLPAEVMDLIVEDMRGYILPKFHRNLSEVVHQYNKLAPYSISAAAVEDRSMAIRMEISFPAVTIPLQIYNYAM